MKRRSLTAVACLTLASLLAGGCPDGTPETAGEPDLPVNNGENAPVDAPADDNEGGGTAVSTSDGSVSIGGSNDFGTGGRGSGDDTPGSDPDTADDAAGDPGAGDDGTGDDGSGDDSDGGDANGGDTDDDASTDPRASLYFDDHGAVGADAVGAHPHLAAATVLVSWRQVNPTPGAYDWTAVDAAIAYWRSVGRKVILRTAPYVGSAVDAAAGGGHPEWVWDFGVEPIAFIDTRGDPFAIPKCFDSPVWLELYGDWIAAMGARYDGSPDVAMVWVGIGHIGHITAQPTESGADALAAAGWTADAWARYIADVTDRFIGAFPSSRVLFPLGEFFTRDCYNRCVEPHILAAAENAVRRGASVMIAGLDPDTETYDRKPYTGIIAGLADETLADDFVLVGKDDFPLYGGVKNRTLADFERALDMLNAEWDQLGRRGTLAILLLKDELQATNPDSEFYEPAVGDALTSFLGVE